MIRAFRRPSVRPFSPHRVSIAFAVVALAALVQGPARAQAPALPQITTGSPLPAGTVSGAYSGSIAASGGTAPYSFGTYGAPPAGLALGAGGSWSGTPTLASASTFMVNVRDAAALGDIGGPTLLDAAGS